MKLSESRKLLLPIGKQCEADNDVLLTVHFSREEDSYQLGATKIMDSGDALIVINDLIKRFDLDRKTIAEME